MKSGFSTVKELVQILTGNAVCAFALGCFALPFDMVVSGMGPNEVTRYISIILP